MPPVNSGGLTSSLMIWKSFISLCFVVVVTMTSGTTLNNCGESGHSCLIPDHRGKALGFSPPRMTLAVSLS